MCKAVRVAVTIVTIGMAASLANPARAGNRSAVGAGLLGFGVGALVGGSGGYTANGVCRPAAACLLRAASSCLCSASASVRRAGVLWPSATSRLSPLTDLR